MPDAIRLMLVAFCAIPLVVSAGYAQSRGDHRSVCFGQTCEDLAGGYSLWLSVSSDGTRVATAGRTAVGVVDYEQSRHVPMQLAQGQSVSAVAISPDGSLLGALVRGVDRTSQVRIWDIDTQSMRLVLPVSDMFRDMAFIPLGSRIGVLFREDSFARSSATLALVDIEDGERSRTVSFVDCDGGFLEPSPDGKVLAIGSMFGATLCLLETATGLLHGYSLPNDPRDVAFDPTGGYLAVAAGHLRITDTEGIAPRDVTGANLLLLDLETNRFLEPLAVGLSDSIQHLAYLTWLDESGLLVAIDTATEIYILDPTVEGTITHAGSLGGESLGRGSIVVDPTGTELYIGHDSHAGYRVVDITDAVATARYERDEVWAQRERVERLATLAREDSSIAFGVVREGTVDEVRDLLAAGVDVNLVDDAGVTLLMAAAESATFEVIARLLAAGADASVVTADGRSALHVAAESNPDHWVATEIVRHGGNPGRRDNRGVAPIDVLPEDLATRLIHLYEELHGPTRAELSADSNEQFVDDGPPLDPPAMPTAQAREIPPHVPSTRVDPAQLEPQADPVEPEPRYVWIEFTSDPSGLELSVDGETIGETPVRVEVTAGRPFSYRIEGRPPDVHPFEGTVTAWSNVVHPTYMTRFTAAERAEYAASRERPATRPLSEAPAPTTRQPVYDSRTGRPAPPPGQRVTATPNYVVAFLANELELRDISCPPAPVSVITCGLSADGEAMISTLLDALFEIYLQPATREVRWYRDGPSGAYVGAFRRPEGVYVISIAGTVVSIGYAGP